MHFIYMFAAVFTCLFLTETAGIFTNIISIIGRFRRDANFYDSVAAATGGTVYNIEKDEITTVLDEVIDVSDRIVDIMCCYCCGWLIK